MVAAYQAALNARKPASGASQLTLTSGDDADDIGMLMQIGMVLWRHLNDLDQAEEYFRRIRKVDPAHPAAVDFYRVYYPAKGEHQKLLALLKQVEKSAAPNAPVAPITGDASGPQTSGRARNVTGRTQGDSSKTIGVEIAELAEARTIPKRRSSSGSRSCAPMRSRSRRARRSRACISAPRSGTRSSI